MKRIIATISSLFLIASGFTTAQGAQAGQPIDLTPATGTTYGAISGQYFTLTASVDASIPAGQLQNVKFQVNNQTTNQPLTTQLSMSGSASDTDVSNSNSPQFIVKTASSSGAYSSRTVNLGLMMGGSSKGAYSVKSWIDSDADDVVDVSEFVSSTRVITVLPRWQAALVTELSEPTLGETSITAFFRSNDPSINISMLANSVKIGFASNVSGTFSKTGSATVVSTGGVFTNGETVSYSSATESLAATVSGLTEFTLGKVFTAQGLLDLNSYAVLPSEKTVVVAGTTVTGTFKQENGTAITNASVNIWSTDDDGGVSKSATTNSQGVFTMSNIPLGDYKITANINVSGKWGRVTKDVTIDSLSTLTSNLVSPNLTGGHTLSGQVRSSSEVMPDGTPKLLSGFVINAYSEGEVSSTSGAYSIFFSTSSNSAGAYSLSGLLPGDLNLTVQRPNQLSRYVSLYETFVMPDSDVVKNFAVNPYERGTSGVAGDVTNHLGEPVQGVSVSLYCGANEDYFYQTTTDTYGGYYFGLLPEANCSLNFYEDSYLGRYLKSFSITAGSIATKNVRLTPIGTSTLSGHIMSSTDPNQPVEGAEISVQFEKPNDGVWWNKTAKTDRDGYYQLTEVPITLESKLKFRVSTSYWDDASEEELSIPYFTTWDPQDVEIPSQGSNIIKDMQLEPLPVGSITYSGTIKNRITGLPISGVKVKAHSGVQSATKYGRKDYSIVTTNSLGNYSIPGVIGGAYLNLEISKSGYLTENYINYPDELETARTKNMSMSPNDVNASAGKISGTILDSNGRPVIFANITLERINGGDTIDVKTDRTGKYLASNLPNGTYVIKANKYGWVNNRYGVLFEFASETVEVTSSSLDVVQDFTLIARQPGATTVKGRLYDTRLGAGVSGIRVYLNSREFNTQSSSITTDANGYWEAKNVNDGSYSLFYEMSDAPAIYKYVPETQVLVNGEAEIVTPTSNTESAGASSNELVVTVRDKVTKAPVTDATVYIWGIDFSGLSFDTRTDAKGKATFSNLPGAQYSVSAYKENYFLDGTQYMAKVDGGDDKATVWLEHLDAVGSISGYVRDGSGQPLSDIQVDAGFSIQFGCCSGDGVGVGATTNSSGYYKLKNIWVNKLLDIGAYADGRDFPDTAPFSGKVRLSEANPNLQNFNITLKAGAKVSGSVSRSNGSPIANLYVNAHDSTSGKIVASATTDATGTFGISAIPAGSTVFSVSENRWPDTGGKFVSGYLKLNASNQWTVVNSLDTATRQTLTSGQKLTLSPLTLSTGGSISGTVMISTNGIVSTSLPHGSRITLYAKNGSSFIEESTFYSTWTSSDQGGAYTISGLPDGIYKVKFEDGWGDIFMNPIYSGNKSTLSAATDVTISNGAIVTSVNATFVINPPSTTPQKTQLGNLTDATKNALKDQVVAEKSADKVKVTVGKEFAGEWVSVGVETTRVSSSALRISAVTAGNSMSDWVQVDGNGVVEVAATGSFSTGQIVVVQDQANKVLGWTGLQISSAGSGSGGGTLSGGGGGGGSTVVPLPDTQRPVVDLNALAPRLIARPVVTGKALVGQTLKSTAGKWLATGSVEVSYQYLRCSSKPLATSKSALPKTCLVTSKNSPSYKVTKADKGKYLAVRVVAKSGSKTSYSTSTGLKVK
jgi:protocatechuate 3,4-dioxygenase beta subunit